MNIWQNKFIKQTIITLTILSVFSFFSSTFVVAQTEQLFTGWSLNLQGEESQTGEISKAGKLLCNKNSFYLFLAFFTEDIEFQLSCARYPLKVTRTEASAVFDSTTMEMLDIITSEFYLKMENQHGKGLFPNYQQMLDDGLHYKVCFAYTNIAEVNLYMEDSGVTIIYIFEWDGFWELIEINDIST